MTYKHHTIPFHEWRIRINPDAKRSDKEFNAPDNVVWLTLAQHIQVHELLYEINQNYFDGLAVSTLSGKIGKEEAHRLAAIESNKRRCGTKASNFGKKNPTHSEFMKNYMKDRKRTPEHQQALTNSYKTRTKFGNTKSWNVLDPNGSVKFVENLASFCRENNWNYTHVISLAKQEKPYRKHVIREAI